MAKQNLSTRRRLHKLGREWNFSHEGIVCNGFSVIVWFNIDQADPEVGYMNDSINEYELTTLTGSPATWLKVSEKDMDNLLTTAMEAVEKAHKEDFNEPDEDY
jgi:hypothetical protein